ncbi:MAG: AraC family transcriptional regulator [Gammaproteobacteria bacterium]|nr:AraC family transcriptional regulator [Gammaproteobacteria bacterium]
MNRSSHRSFRVIDLVLLATLFVAAPAWSESTAASMDDEIQDLKAEILDLNRELFLLEEELLFPANTQIAIFVSMDVGEFFALDSVQVKLDGKEVGNYLYTEREVAALHRGGVHQLFLGNVKTGDHELVAIFTGLGPHGREYRRGATLNFDKQIGAKFVELRITDREIKQQPEFFVREWE